MAGMSGSDEELVGWLRAQIEARKATAEAATCAPWEAEGDDPTDDEVWIDPDDGSAIRLVILRGPGSHENMLHVAANDPQDTIARCEAELAILDEHDDVHSCPGALPGGARPWHYPYVGCRTVRLLASGYRSRPGYREEWKP